MEQNKPLILVADDQQLNQKLISLIIGKLGYDSILAGDGEDAVEKAKIYKPVLIFMDIQMPKMNGCEAAEKLRALGFSMPIIAVTAADLPDESENCFNAGMNGVLFKPAKKADIEKTLGKWLGGGESSAALGAEKTVSAQSETSGVFSAEETVSVQSETSGVFNAEEMLSNFMNNKKLVTPLLSRFISRTREQLKNMPNPESGSAGEDALRNIHMIRGAAFTMGGAELGKAAAALEKAYAGAAEGEISAAYFELLAAFGDFTKEAEEFIRGGS